MVVVFHYCSYLGGGGVSRVGKSSGCNRLRLWYTLVSTSVILNHCIKTRFLVCISSNVFYVQLQLLLIFAKEINKPRRGISRSYTSPFSSVSSDVRSSFFWHLARRRLVTDVSGKPIGPIFKGQAIQLFFLDCLNREDGSDRLSRSTIYCLQDSRSTQRWKPQISGCIAFFFSLDVRVTFS